MFVTIKQNYLLKYLPICLVVMNMFYFDGCEVVYISSLIWVII